MIEIDGDFSAARGWASTALNNNIVSVRPGRHTARRETVEDRPEPVAFLDPQFRHSAHPCLARRNRRRDGDNGVFVNHRRRTRRRDIDTGQRTMAKRNVGDLFAGGLAFIGICQISAHLAQCLEKTGAQRIHADIFDRYHGSRHNQRRHAGIGCRGRIAGHRDIGCRQFGESGDRNLAPAIVQYGNLDVRTKRPEHVFGMVPRCFALRYGGGTGRVERRQQHRRFHLGGRDRHIIFDRDRFRCAMEHKRHAAAFPCIEGSTHLRQRDDHPVHRPRPQRRITSKMHLHVLCREQAHQ